MALAVAMAALVIVPGPPGPAASAADDGDAVTVTARDLVFEPSVIQAQPGTDLEVTLVNAGLQPHNIAFYLREGGERLAPGSVSPIIGAGASTRVSFTTPGPGEYFFVCDVHPRDMAGRLVVGSGLPAPVRDEPSDRAMLPLGDDPRVGADDFRVTTFATGLPYTTSMQPLPDGSLLVAVNDAGQRGLVASTGKLLRLADRDGDGVAEEMEPIGTLARTGPGGPLVYRDLPGAIIQMRIIGDLLVMTTRQRLRSRIIVLRSGPTVSDPWTVSATLVLAFPEDHLHDTYALAVKAGEAEGSVDVYFNVGSRLNAAADAAPIETSHLLETSLVPGSVYRMTLVDDGTSIAASGLRLIAVGLRNAAGLAFHPATGDLYLQDNGMDREDDPEDQSSADELNVIPADRLGREVFDFGFPRGYVAYRTDVRVGGGVPPLVAFQPIEGSEAEGAAEIAFAPPGFPERLRDGIFIGFHGRYSLAGLPNEENPLLFVDVEQRTRFEFVPNDAPDVGHLDSILATGDSLFIADLNRLGQLSTAHAEGVIYQVKARGTGG